MKRIILPVLALILGLTCMAETKQALTLFMSSGGKVVYLLEEQPRIGFAGQQMIVSVDGKSDEIPMADVDRWELGFEDFSGIDTPVTSEEPTVHIDGQSVYVCTPTPATINVYSMDGRTAATATGCNASFTLSKGIYIITINNQSYKIAIR